MGKNQYARAVVLREKVLTPYDLKILQNVSGDAHSYVRNKDYDEISAMYEALRDHPETRKKLSPRDLSLIYSMSQGIYGGIEISERNEFIQREEQVAKTSLDAQVEKEQRQLRLSNSGIPIELWDEVKV